MKDLKKNVSDNVIENVDCIELKNQGGFVTRLKVYHKKSEFGKPDEKGETKDITLGFHKSINLSTTDGINEGDLVTAYARVILGKNNHSDVWFKYKKGCNKTAKFTISGTTLDNELGFNGIK